MDPLTPAERRRSRMRTLLMESALRRFDRDGYEATTIADIADDADISTRTFFRYFADKEDVLFPDNRELHAVVDAIIADAPRTAPPVDVLMTALAEVAGQLEPSRDRLRMRARVIAASPALRGREQLKYLEWQDSALTHFAAGGRSAEQAALAVGLAFAVWREAYRRWILGIRPRRTLATHLVTVRDEVDPLVIRPDV